MTVARKVLIAKPEIPMQRVARPSVYIMPDPEPRKGDIERLVENLGVLPRIFAAFALGAGVALTAFLLDLAAKAAHIPVPR